MSGDADDLDPVRLPQPNPRRAPGPRPGGDPRGRDEEASGPSTYRPNPKRRAAGRARDERTEPVPQGPNWTERILFGRVGSGQLAVFCRQFAAYLDAGVDILKALSSLQDQYAGTALGPVLGRMLQGVRQGRELAELAASEPQAFDPLFVSMIKVAEARGGVPETLRGLSRHYEARQRLIRQARSAMIYPIIVLIAAGAVVALLTLFLLPMLVDLLSDISRKGAQLPLPSRILMGFSAFVGLMGWWLIPLVVIGTPILLFRAYRTAAGKEVMDRVALRIPVLGQLLRKVDTTRFARTLASLLNAGVDVGSSLDLTSDVLQLNPFRRAVRESRAEVMEGVELSDALARSRRFSADVVAVVNSGEETGKLPESLDRLADDYEEQVSYMVRNLGQLVQPVLLIFLGGLVLFIILAVLLPYIALLTSLGGAG